MLKYWNKEYKKEWLEALRSSKYQQGTKRLNWNNKFCCLGVRCDLLVKKGIGKWQDPERYYNRMSQTRESMWTWKGAQTL